MFVIWDLTRRVISSARRDIISHDEMTSEGGKISFQGYPKKDDSSDITSGLVSYPAIGTAYHLLIGYTPHKAAK